MSTYEYLINYKQPIEKVVYPQGEFALLSKCGPVEVIEQLFKPDNILTLYATEHVDAHEIYYILEGSMSGVLKGESVHLSVGDSFQINQLSEDLFFETKEGVRFLCITTHPTFHHLSDMIHELLETVKTIEEKDPYTKDHSFRVQNWSYKIANQLGMPSSKLEALCLAALLHDIGKINIPEHILNKPGSLTEDEYNIVKQHPKFGSDMLLGTIMDQGAVYVAHHHERLDGTGYPNGIKGDAICLEARIIAVADVFDAMTTDRSYRKGLPVEMALFELESNMDMAYDREVVLALKAVLETTEYTSKDKSAPK